MTRVALPDLLVLRPQSAWQLAQPGRDWLSSASRATAAQLGMVDQLDTLIAQP